MLYKIISPLILIFLVTLMLSACGANSPAGTGGVSVGNGKTALTMTINFPPRTAPAGLTALISASTQTIEIRVSKGATFNPLAVIASTTITAPAGGGPATATLVLTNPGPVVSVSIVSRDAAGNWLGEVKEENKAIVIGSSNPVGAVMLEVHQGVNMLTLPAGSRPVIYAPDGTAYAVRMVYIGKSTTASGSVFNINAECEVASGAIPPVVVTRDTTVLGTIPPVIRTDAAVVNGKISGTITFFNLGSTLVGKDYIFTFTLNATNIPTLTITQSTTGPVAPPPLNTTVTQPIHNNVIIQPVASATATSYYNAIIARTTPWIYNVRRSATYNFVAPVGGVINSRTDTASGSITIQYIQSAQPLLTQTTTITTIRGTASPTVTASTSTVTGILSNSLVSGLQINTGSGPVTFLPASMTVGTGWINNGSMLIYANPNSIWNYTVIGFSASLPAGVSVPPAILLPNDLMAVTATVVDKSLPNSNLTGTATIYLSPSLGGIVYMKATVSGTLPIPGTAGIIGTGTITQEMLISGGISVIVI